MAANNLLSGLRSEYQLLLACARTTFDGPTLASVGESLGQPLNWTYVVEHADRQRVVPLVYRSLSRGLLEHVPPEAVVALRAHVRAATHQGLLLTGELLRVLTVLEQHDIPAMPYKGPMLAAQMYGDLALRQYGDLDVWIHAQDFLRARKIVMSNGYNPYLPPSDDLLNAAYPRIHHEYGFMRNDGLIHLELLWKVIQRPFGFPRDVDSWWNQLVDVPFAGRRVRTLPPELLLLSLCVHGSKHLWERLIWVCDVAELLRATPQLDWDCLLENAQRLGARRMLLLGLHLAHQLLAAPLPGRVPALIVADTRIVPLAELACELLFREGPFPPEIYAKAHLFHFRMLERLRDRLNVGLRYSQSFLKPVHLYKKYGLEPLRHLFGA